MKTREVKHEIFFHTSVTVEGQKYFDNNPTIIIDPAKSNPRHSELINYAPTINLEIGKFGWLRYLDYLIANNNILGQPNNWTILLESLTEITYRINNRYFEKIFEEIRQNEFTQLPSRYSCIYLADKDNVELWHKKALEQLKQKEFPIYEFKATGQIHYADPEWLEVDIVSDDEFRDIARKYWDGEASPTAKEDLREILFSGTLILEKKHSNIDEYKKNK